MSSTVGVDVGAEAAVHRIERSAAAVDLAESGERVGAAKAGREVGRIEPGLGVRLEHPVGVLERVGLAGVGSEMPQGAGPFDGEGKRAAEHAGDGGRGAERLARLLFPVLDAMPGVAGP